MWAEGANSNTPKTPPSHSWGRFSAHISQIQRKVLKGYESYDSINEYNAHNISNIGIPEPLVARLSSTDKSNGSNDHDQ